MPKARVTERQRNALREARLGGLIRRRDGWASGTAYGAHCFTTVHSLIERGLLTVRDNGKRVLITAAGKEALE